MMSDPSFEAGISPATARWALLAMPMSCLKSQTPEAHQDTSEVVGRPLNSLRAKLPNPGQPFEMVGAGPHPEPAVTLRREPSPGVNRLLTTVRCL